MSIWLTAEQVIVLGYSRPTLFRHLSKLTTRAGARAANGRHRKEIALESLPPEIQARYFKCKGDRPVAPTTEASAGTAEEGESVKAVHLPANAEPEPPSRAEAALSPNQPEAESQVRAVREPPLLLQKTDSANAGVPRAIHESPLHGMSETALEEITDYAEKIKAADGKPRKLRAWIARSIKPHGVSLSTLDRDIAAFRAQGLAALLRLRRTDRGASRVADKQVVADIQKAYLRPHRPTAKNIYRKVAKDYTISGLTPPSYSFVLRTVNAIHPDLVEKYRVGEKSYNNKFAYYSEREKPPLPRQWVDADHHECDHFVRFPDGTAGRPWLTAAQDICTNEILGFNIPRDKRVGDGRYPGAESIALAIRRSILRKKEPAWPSFGLFEHLYVDLGKDFISKRIAAVCIDLNISVENTRGYHGQSKPIERWFGIMEDGLKHLPGYCGNKPENNPARQKAKPEPIDPKSLLSIDEFEERLRDWIVNEFHHADSRALKGISPVDALAAHVKNGFAVREVRDERALDLLLMQRAKRTVMRGRINMFGRSFVAPEILDLGSQEVEVAWDDANVGEVLIYSGARFICKAANGEMLKFGATKEMLKREHEIKRDQKRRLRERYGEIVKAAEYGGDPLAQAAAETLYDKVVGEERQKIAVNAEAPSAAVILPKYHQAAKQLRAPTARRGATSIRAAAGLAAAPLADKPRAKEAWEIEDELPTGAEIFKRPEKAEWEKALDAEDE